MATEELPLLPPPGKIRYIATYVMRGTNPFAGRGPTLHTRTADMDTSLSFEQVKSFARQMEDEHTYFHELQVVE